MQSYATSYTQPDDYHGITETYGSNGRFLSAVAKTTNYIPCLYKQHGKDIYKWLQYPMRVMWLCRIVLFGEIACDHVAIKWMFATKLIRLGWNLRHCNIWKLLTFCWRRVRHITMIFAYVVMDGIGMNGKFIHSNTWNMFAKKVILPELCKINDTTSSLLTWN